MDRELRRFLHGAVTVTVTLHEFETAEAMFDAAAEAVASALQGGGTLVCSGGTTPAPLYARLAVATLPWARIAVTLSDERWVDAGSPDSNEGLVRRTLPEARLTPLKTEIGRAHV